MFSRSLFAGSAFSRSAFSRTRKRTPRKRRPCKQRPSKHRRVTNTKTAFARECNEFKSLSSSFLFLFEVCGLRFRGLRFRDTHCDENNISANLYQKYIRYAPQDEHTSFVTLVTMESMKYVHQNWLNWLYQGKMVSRHCHLSLCIIINGIYLDVIALFNQNLKGRKLSRAGPSWYEDAYLLFMTKPPYCYRLNYSYCPRRVLAQRPKPEEAP